MSESEHLTKLREGAYTCLHNAERLLEDSRILFCRKSYLSSFLLAQLSLEELAKGFKLIEKHLKKDSFSRKEWKNLTKGGRAHVRKLKYLKEVQNRWTEKVSKKPNLNYRKALHKIVSKTPWLNSIDDFWEAMSKMEFQWRLNSIYIDYDWKEKRWIKPSELIIEGFCINEAICLSSIIRAEYLSKLLKHEALKESGETSYE